MKKLLMFLIIILLACPLYAQQELDSDTSGSVDAEIGGTNQDTWVAGEIPYCSAATGAAGDGELDGMPYYSYQTDHIRIASDHTICFGDTDNMCIMYDSGDNRLEFTTALAAYFTGSIITAPSDPPRMTFYDSACPSTATLADQEVGYIEIDEDDVGGSGTEYADIKLYSMENGTENQRMIYDASEGAWITTKGFAGGKYIIPDANGRTIGATEAYGAVHVATGPGTWILPDECDTATGANICLYQTGADEVIIDLPAEDNFVYEGTPETDGEAMDSTAAAGEYICVYCLVANEWHVMEHTTGWTGE